MSSNGFPLCEVMAVKSVEKTKGLRSHDLIDREEHEHNVSKGIFYEHRVLSTCACSLLHPWQQCLCSTFPTRPITCFLERPATVV